MNLFKIDNNYNLVLDESATWLHLPEFKELLSLKYNKGEGDSDGRERKRGLAELKLIFLLYDFRSPYAEYNEAEKLSRCLKAVNLTTNKEPDSPQYKAVKDIYIETQHQHPGLKACTVASNTLNKMINTLESMEFITEDEEVIDKMAKTTNMLTKLIELGKSVSTERDNLMAALANTVKGRGGVTISKRENPNYRRDQ